MAYVRVELRHGDVFWARALNSKDKNSIVEGAAVEVGIVDWNHDGETVKINPCTEYIASVFCRSAPTTTQQPLQIIRRLLLNHRSSRRIHNEGMGVRMRKVCKWLVGCFVVLFQCSTTQYYFPGLISGSAALNSGVTGFSGFSPSNINSLLQNHSWCCWYLYYQKSAQLLLQLTPSSV